ncbi:MAG: six-cysteine ranthipeptide SCIFF [Candidatus Saccharibacteria bacterium]
MGKHIKTIVAPVLKKGEDTNCRECQASCQSACKTSCTVGNQVCKK